MFQFGSSLPKPQHQQGDSLNSNSLNLNTINQGGNFGNFSNNLLRPTIQNPYQGTGSLFGQNSSSSSSLQMIQTGLIKNSSTTENLNIMTGELNKGCPQAGIQLIRDNSTGVNFSRNQPQSTTVIGSVKEPLGCNGSDCQLKELILTEKVKRLEKSLIDQDQIIKSQRDEILNISLKYNTLLQKGQELFKQPLINNFQQSQIILPSKSVQSLGMGIFPSQNQQVDAFSNNFLKPVTIQQPNSNLLSLNGNGTGMTSNNNLKNNINSSSSFRNNFFGMPNNQIQLGTTDNSIGGQNIHLCGLKEGTNTYQTRYQPTKRTSLPEDGSCFGESVVNLNSITAMDTYLNKTFEELRHEDYMFKKNVLGSDRIAISNQLMPQQIQALPPNLQRPTTSSGSVFGNISIQSGGLRNSNSNPFTRTNDQLKNTGGLSFFKN